MTEDPGQPLHIPLHIPLGTVLCSLQGTEPAESERALLRHPQAGGVVLFERNFRDLEQLAGLLAELRALRTPPLLITVDQEGGRVQRLREGFSRLPPPAALGVLHESDPTAAAEAAAAVGWLMAAELRAAGVDLSFAPLLDLDRGGSELLRGRAFSAHPGAVAELAAAWIAGARRAGMAAVGKHYPGHGGVAEDSHRQLPRDPRPRSELEQDLRPFRHAMDQGLPALMTAHVLYPRLDREQPAGFSPVILRELLRKELGFQGVLFSDDLCMVGAHAAGSPAGRARAACRAGCELLLVCNCPQAAREVMDAVAEATREQESEGGESEQQQEQRPEGARAGLKPRAARVPELYGRPAPGWEELRARPEWRAARAWCVRLGS